MTLFPPSKMKHLASMQCTVLFAYNSEILFAQFCLPIIDHFVCMFIHINYNVTHYLYNNEMPSGTRTAYFVYSNIFTKN
jgi:hypothetical protein